MEITIVVLGIILISFLCEYMDAALGMGYGTTLTPLLLILGFKPLEVVPTVLLSQFVTSITAGFFHHRLGNVNFSRGSLHLKIVSILTISGIFGSVVAVMIAIKLPPQILKLYIGGIICLVGLLTLANFNRQYSFSWGKITGLGVVAAFNKGLSGGGYGPVVTGGQILSGLNGKNAIGIAALAEGLTCLVAFLLYVQTKSVASWSLVPYVMAGAILSVPFSVVTVKKLNTNTLHLAIGVITTLLGIVTLVR